MKVIKLFVLIVIMVGGVKIIEAQTENWIWAERAGGSYSAEGLAVTTDQYDYIYVTGLFHEYAIFDSLTLSANGNQDLFVGKLDGDGNWLWVVNAGSNLAAGRAIVTDSEHQVYVTGNFQGSITFNTPTPTTLTSDQGSDSNVFVAKLDDNGNWIWAVKAGGMDCTAYGIDVDGHLNTYITGSFSEEIFFSSITLSDNASGLSSFAAKIDPSGNWEWAIIPKSPNYPEQSVGYAVAIDKTNHPGDYLYITGYYEIPNQSSHVYVSKLTTNNGNLIWEQVSSGNGYDYGRSITVDDWGQIHLTGDFAEDTYFSGIYLHTNLRDIFVAALDSSGSWLWAQQAGGVNDVNDIVGRGIALDDQGNIFVTGNFSDHAIFDSIQLSSYGLSDTFVAKLDGSGNWLMARKGGSIIENDYGYGIALDTDTNAYITGSFRDSAFFGNTGLLSIGEEDIFVAKLGLSPTPPYPGNIIHVQEAWASPIIFPVGIVIQFEGNNPAQVLTVEYYDEEPEGNIIEDDYSPVEYIAPVYWSISSNHQEPGTYNITFDISGRVSGVNDPDNLHLLKRDNSSDPLPWQDFGVANEVNMPLFRWEAITGFSEFTFGGYGTNNFQEDSPLPIELSSFTADVTESKSVCITWIVESENNMLGYNLYKGNNNYLSESVKTNSSMIMSNNSSIIKDYYFIDEEVEEGELYYYWLQAVNMDLTSNFIGPISILVEYEEETETLPETLTTELVGAYPNPFNPAVEIKFSLVKPSEVTIKIYNNLGQHIQTLVTERYCDKGVHTVSWDGKDSYGNITASGIYFYKMETSNSFRDVKKMLMLK